MESVLQVLLCCCCLVSLSMAAFICEKDGHFGDEIDCSKYYHCANGRPNAGFCPAGLFWNQATSQCDWPEVTDCDFSIEKARQIQIEHPTKVYMTFDDGPDEGTDEVLDALKAFGVSATFFINSKNLDMDPKKPERAALNANMVLRVVKEGHLLADHSYDHMWHNSKGPKDAYTNVENDLGYFGNSNAAPVLSLLAKAGVDGQTLARVNHTMNSYVRMPYSNNWRVAVGPKNRSPLVANCLECTLPAKSAKAAVQIADILSEERGAKVFGWDLEWNMNFDTGRVKYGGLQMFMRLGAGTASKRPGHTIVLAHDAAFRPHEITGAKGDKEELVTFLDLATNAGYKFETLDYYGED